MSTTRIKDYSSEHTNGSDSVSSNLELLYIWIERDRADFIREVGFNFSPNYRFDMKRTEDGKYELSCTESKKFQNIWKYGNINGLTAVVGENGSGKSLLLRHLWEFGAVRKRYPFKTVYVYLVNDKVQIRHNFSSNHFINATEFDICRPLYGQTRIYMSNGLSSQEFSHAEYPDEKRILFTPAVNNIRFKEFFKKKLCVNQFGDNQLGFNTLQQELISCLQYSNFETLCILSYYHYLQSRKRDTLPLVKGVDTFTVDIFTPCDLFRSGELRPLTNTSTNKMLRNRLSKLLRSFKKWEDKILTQIGSDPVAKAYISLIFELCFLINTDCDFDVCGRNDLEEQSKKLLERIKELPASHPAVIAYYENALEEIKDLGNVLPVSFLPGNSVGSIYRAYVMIDRRKCSSIYVDFCKYVDKLMRKPNSFLPKYILVHLQPQSSGEQALQNIFAWLSLYSSFGEMFGEQTVEIGHNVLLLLDEVDLYMHPEWQRQFLNLLSEELNAEYPDKKIQVVISTHSPLVLSDIPSSNIIYLKHEGDSCTFASGPEQNRTFGANIFTLLKDSFFMSKPLGEFAYARIVEISKKLNELKANPDDVQIREQYRELDKLIDLIGEPVVRRKLQMLYDEVFPNNNDTEHRRFLEDLNGLYMSEDPEDRKKYQDLLKAMRSGSFGN